MQNAFQNLAVNWGPLLETMSVGILCNLTTCCMSKVAVSDAEGSLVREDEVHGLGEPIYDGEDGCVVVGYE